MSQNKEQPLSDAELLAFRVMLKQDAFNAELKKRLGTGMVTAEKITSALVKCAIAIGVMYAWGIDVLKHILGISK
jgi:hypothetical protein